MAKIIWLTGLPSSGKTTIANALSEQIDAVILDGDVMRSITNDFGFSPEDRKAHLIKMIRIASLIVCQTNVICAFVSPDEKVRRELKEIIGENMFVEVFVDCPLKDCIKRDVKGLYEQALSGKIKNFTGIDAPYEKPINPEIHLHTDASTVAECVTQITSYLDQPTQPAALFIGRWNGVFHYGHDFIVNDALSKDQNVILAVRNVAPDKQNPWTAYEVKDMLKFYYRYESRVEIIIIPDISSVNYGRGVGYDINRVSVDDNLAVISGTDCRELIAKGNFDKLGVYVPQRIKEYLQQKATG